MSDAITIPQPVAVVVLVREGKVLIGERLDGRWGFPGGKQQLWEPLFETARRELLEETGLQLISATPFFVADDPEPASGQHFVTAFLLGSAEGEPQLLEPQKCRGWHWLTIDEIPGPILAGTAALIASGWRP